MAIQIPDLASANCRIITVCGEILSDNPTMLQWCKKPKGQNWLDYLLETPSGVIYARIGLGGRKGKHCHVDLATPENFTDEGRPKPTRGDAEFQAMLAPLLGEPIDMRTRCKFALKVSEFPPFILPLSRIVGSSDKVSIRLVGGELAVKGSAVQSLSWHYQGDDKPSTLTISEDNNAIISDSYLVDTFGRLRMYLKTFQEGGAPDVNS